MTCANVARANIMCINEQNVYLSALICLFTHMKRTHYGNNCNDNHSPEIGI